MEGEGPPGFVRGPIELTCSFTREVSVIRKMHDGTDQGMDYSWVTGVVIASNSRQWGSTHGSGDHFYAGAK
jgi:hypothetical protein